MIIYRVVTNKSVEVGFCYLKNFCENEEWHSLRLLISRLDGLGARTRSHS